MRYLIYCDTHECFNRFRLTACMQLRTFDHHYYLSSDHKRWAYHLGWIQGGSWGPWTPPGYPNCLTRSLGIRCICGTLMTPAEPPRVLHNCNKETASVRTMYMYSLFPIRFAAMRQCSIVTLIERAPLQLSL